MTFNVRDKRIGQNGGGGDAVIKIMGGHIGQIKWGAGTDYYENDAKFESPYPLGKNPHHLGVQSC